MGFDKNKRPFHSPENISTATLSTAAATLVEESLNLITVDSSGQPNDAIIPDPTKRGLKLAVAVDNQTTSEEANFTLASTGNTLFGTTFNTINLDTTVGNNFFDLTAASTSQWVVTNLSGPEPATSTGTSGQKHWTFANTTGSTAS